MVKTLDAPATTGTPTIVVEPAISSVDLARLDTRNEFPVPSDEEFGELAFLDARKLKLLADELIKDVPELRGLRHLTIAYVWQRKGPKTAGRPVYGKTSIPGGLNRHLSKVDAVVTISADHCREAHFTYFQMTATLDHQLQRIAIDENDKLVTNEPDLVMYFGEYERYGAWRAEIRVAEQVFQQKLPF